MYMDQNSSNLNLGKVKKVNFFCVLTKIVTPKKHFVNI